MTIHQSMDCYEARLASFNVAYSATKKRASETRGVKTLRWSHKHLSPPELARAGFFFQPTSSCPDNTTCYLCRSNVDGWEDEDDALEEHLKLSPDCGWAITVAIEQDIENGSYSLEDPMSEKVLNARRMTFGTNWPHENKRGWTCKIQKMIEAGWHYCPTFESDDFVKCSYCNLSLDGWEPKDKPFDEHQRRSPDCSFFTLYASMRPKQGRPKKGRASKASRMSTQSNVATASEGLSIVEMERNPDESMMSIADSDKLAKSTRGKKAGKARKAPAKAKARSTKSKQDESQMASSFLEPEDDNFEVKVDNSPAPVTSSRKRKSDDISALGENHENLQSNVEASESQIPAKRQRRTRANADPSQVQDVSTITPSNGNEADLMTDTEMMPPPPAPAPKKRGKGGKKRASSMKRKASTASTASKASLRADMVADEDIEAALEADLNRPLTDEEGDVEPVEVVPPKGRRLTRTKPGSKKTTASVAPTRRGTRASSISVVEPPVTSFYPTVPVAPTDKKALEAASNGLDADLGKTDEVSQKAMHAEVEMLQNQSIEREVEEHEIKTPLENIASAEELETQDANRTIQPEPNGVREASQIAAAMDTQASDPPSSVDAVHLGLGTNSPTMDTQTTKDDSGHETDASVIKQTRPKRGGRKAPVAAKKAKGGKKTGRKRLGEKDTETTSAINPQTEVRVQKTSDKARDTTSVPDSDAVEAVPSGEQDSDLQAVKPPTAKGKAPKPKVLVIQDPPSTVTQELNAVTTVEDTPALPPPATSSMPRPGLSPQSSDAENQPPSSRPSHTRPPLAAQSPSKSQSTKVPLATTPVTSPSKSSFSKLHSTFPWTAVDLENVFQNTPSADKENNPFIFAATMDNPALTSPEKKLTVEEWIHFNAQRGEERLRNECERLVGKFEGEGMKALRTLEGIVCAQ